MKAKYLRLDKLLHNALEHFELILFLLEKNQVAIS